MIAWLAACRDADPPAAPDGPTRLEVECAPTANPLRFTCDVVVEPPQAVVVSYARADGASVVRTAESPDEASQHTVPLVFLAGGQDYDVTAWASASPEKIAATTLRAGRPDERVRSSLEVTGTSTVDFVGSHLPCQTDDAVAVVYDTSTGDLVWYEVMDPGGRFGTLDMVRFTDDHTVLGESLGDVIEVDLNGEVLVYLPGLAAEFGADMFGLFGDFHHDIAVRDGVYAVFFQDVFGGGFVADDVLDTVVLFDATGAELARWWPVEHLDLPEGWGGDFLHTNTVAFDAHGDLLLSWYAQDTVAKIAGDWTRPDFGVVQWTLRGDPAGVLGSTITADWSAVPGPDGFLRQHALSERPDGRIELLDNGNGRALVITVDPDQGTATVDAAYDAGRSECGPQGTAGWTTAGNVFAGCAEGPLFEYDAATGDAIWEARVKCPIPANGAARWTPLEGW